MTRHAAGHGVNRVLYFAAFLFNQLGEFAHLMLCLSDGHAVAGDHDHLARVRQQNCRVFYGDAFGRKSFGGARACGSAA